MLFQRQGERSPVIVAQSAIIAVNAALAIALPLPLPIPAHFTSAISTAVFVLAAAAA
jgi:hypothetical protein